MSAAQPNDSSEAKTPVLLEKQLKKGPTRSLSGYDRLVKYIDQCTPSVPSESKEDWNVIQSLPEVKFLPLTKFHDLVFGQVLGEGIKSLLLMIVLL